MANTYILVVFGILCAKAGGFLRDAIFASHFGTGIEADIYLQIFGIASLIFTAVGSALSTLIIKNINKSKYSQGDGQKRYGAYFIRHICVLVILVTVLLYIFAKQIVGALLPGLEGEDARLALKIMYIMLPSFLFISVAYMMSGLLQNRRVFFTPSVMSLPYNVIVICTLLFGMRDIELISIITTVGWFLHIVILLPDFYRKGYSFFSPSEGIEKKGELASVLETVFIFVSGLMFQLCFMTDKTFASFDGGMVSTLGYASNLFITFSGIFVVAMSSVVFPAISQNYEYGAMDYVRELVRYMIKLMVSIFSFYLIAVIFFGDFAISVIYEHGEFTHADTVRVAHAFVIYSFAIFGYLAQNVLNKLFYLAGKYNFTVIGAIVVVALNAMADFVLVPHLGVYSAAISTTVLLSLYALFIMVKLKGVIGKYFTSELMMSLGKIAISSAVTVVITGCTMVLLPQSFTTGNSFIRVVPFILAVVVYAVCMLSLGVLKDLFTTPLSKRGKSK